MKRHRLVISGTILCVVLSGCVGILPPTISTPGYGKDGEFSKSLTGIGISTHQHSIMADSRVAAYGIGIPGLSIIGNLIHLALWKACSTVPAMEAILTGAIGLNMSGCVDAGWLRRDTSGG